MSGPELIDQAISAFDRVLAARPRRDGAAFTEATKAVCAYRDELRAELRGAPDAEGPRRRLRSANLIVTLLISGHYPLGETPWDALEGLRERLQALKPDSVA